MNQEFGYLLAFSTGILGAFHCIGMCSGINGGFFACYQQRPNQQSPMIIPVLGFHAARIAVYSILGIIGALLGRTIVQVGIFGKMQGVLMIISGILVILIGLYLLGVFGKRKQKQTPANEQTIKFINPSIPTASMKAKLAPFVAGIFNGLVPCSLVFSVAIKASGTADPIEAGLLMLAFGLGTLPTMAMVSIAGSVIGAQTYKLVQKLAAVSVIALGIWTLYEGWIFFDIMRGLSN